ncbi:MAG: hypothetical protein ACRDH1_04985, partial [Actinomycetota bacterium]
HNRCPQVCNSVGKCIGAAQRRPREEVRDESYTHASSAPKSRGRSEIVADLRRRDVALVLLLYFER